MKSFVHLSILGIVCIAFSTARANSVYLPLTDDAYINGNSPNADFGARGVLFVHDYGPKQSLVRFDASSVAGQNVSRATLRLYLNDIRSSGVMTVHAITSSWSESTVTWNNQPPYEIQETAIVNLSTGDEDSVIEIDVTSTVIRWANGSLSDSGFLLVTSDGIRAYFDANERTGGTPPSLEVDTGQSQLLFEQISVLDGAVLFGDRHNRTYWEKEVIISSESLAAARSAHIAFRTIHADLGRLVVNGQAMQLPDTTVYGGGYDRWRTELAQTYQSIPLGFLSPGVNVIRFEAGEGNWAPDNIYDDYELSDVDLVLSKR